MPTDTRDSSRTHPRESSFVSLMSGWAQQGVQSYFATQRLLMDLAMRQNASVMHVIRERLTDPRHSPANILSELADEGLTNLIDAHQVLLDLGRQQNEIVMTAVKERVGQTSATAAMADLLRRSVDTVIDMQQKFLKIADKQTHTWVDTAKSGKPPKGDVLVDLAREAMENFVHCEKQFLDIVAEETAKATGNKHTNGAKKVKKSELTDIGRQATESFIDAQKKLFDVAGRQMNTNLKAAGRTMDIAGPMPIVPFSDLTREGVKTFVDAQKALMDVMTKPHNGAKHQVKAHPARKTARSTKTRAAHMAAAV
jgi:hypothetical protein